MMAKCGQCGCGDSVERLEDDASVCECKACGARYEVEGDADYEDGWSWIDCSGPGNLIRPGDPQRIEAERARQEANARKFR